MTTSLRPVSPFQKIPTRTFGLVLMGLSLLASAQAQSMPVQGPVNWVSLSANAQIEATQDMLGISLNTTKEGPDANAVQVQLKQAIEDALAVAKPQAKPGAMEVRTGQFSLNPRYGRDSKITGWVGTAEVVLEGKDFARIGAIAGKIQSLTVNQVGYALSRELRAQLEVQAQAKAIESFRSKAQAVSQSFGFAGYSLREINVSAQEPPMYAPRPRMLAMAKGGADAESALPVEAGKSAVTVVVSGSVQMK